MKYASCLGGVAAALLGLGSSLFGQEPVPAAAAPPAELPAPSVVDAPAPGGPTPGGPAAYPPGISTWLAYPRSPICCGNVGKHGLIQGEWFTRAGVSVPLGANNFATNVNPGLSIGTGWRTLLFNPAMDDACVVEFAIRSTWWSVTDSRTYTLFDVPLPGTDVFGNSFRGTQVVTPTRLHMTTFDASIGRETYLWGNAACDGTSKCRVGADIGGSWGNARMDFAVERHRTDAIGAAFAAVHADYECPFGCCMFYAGIRLEYGYMFNDLLQRQNPTDVQAVSALISTGFRF